VRHPQLDPVHPRAGYPLRSGLTAFDRGGDRPDRDGPGTYQGEAYDDCAGQAMSAHFSKLPAPSAGTDRAFAGTVRAAVTVERLTDEDARILARERGTIRGHMCKILVIAGEHDVNALRTHVEPRLAALPRLRERLVAAPLGIAPPAWAPQEDFELDSHVRDGGRADDRAQLERAVARLMEERLDRERPLWSIDVVALGEDRTALVLRLHHCMADGATAMRILRRLVFDHDAPETPEPAALSPAAGPSRSILLADALRWRAARIARGVRNRRGAATDDGGRSRERRLAALRRELSPEGRPSPLARPAGPRRQVAFSSFPLDDIKAVGHAAPERATVNDVVLAAVAGALRRWLAHIGAEAGQLRVKVPVSLHAADEPETANRDSFMVVQLPLDAPDPVARLCAIAAETRERKAAHDADELDAFFNDLGRLSRSLERLASRWAMSPRVFALNVSNVPGPKGQLGVMGSPLLELHTVAEIADRHVLRVAVVSAVGGLSFGLCADADAVERLDLVRDGIAAELRALRTALPTVQAGSNQPV
jgi:diacylglycerol O-acyltransferase / wax synthase